MRRISITRDMYMAREIFAGSSLMNCLSRVIYGAVYPADVSAETTKLID